MGNLSLSIWDHLVAVFIGVVLPLLAVFRGVPDTKDLSFDTRDKIKLYYSNGAILWLGALIIIGLWIFQGRFLENLGFRSPDLNIHSIGWTLLLLVLYFANWFFETKIPSRRAKTVEQWRSRTPFMPQNNSELAHYSFMAFSAGFCEEVVFRGYLFNYLLALFGDATTGQMATLLLSAVLFGVLHLYQGKKGMFKVVFAAILFGLIFLSSKSLWWVAALHFFVNFLSGMAGMSLLKKNIET